MKLRQVPWKDGDCSCLAGSDKRCVMKTRSSRTRLSASTDTLKYEPVPGDRWFAWTTSKQKVASISLGMEMQQAVGFIATVHSTIGGLGFSDTTG